jgi:hypothetical protein
VADDGVNIANDLGLSPDVEAQVEALRMRLISSGKIPPEEQEVEVVQTQVRQATQTRTKAAVSMRIAGASYAEIAEVLEFDTAATARGVVERGIAGTYDDPENIEAMRGMARARLETLLRSIAPKALSDKKRVTRNGKTETVENPEHLAYAREFRATVDRLVALDGLAAPQVHRFETPAVDQFNEVLREVIAQRNAIAAPEADIFDAEEVVDDVDDLEGSVVESDRRAGQGDGDG